LFGFALAGLLLLGLRFLSKNSELNAEPNGDQPPVWWVRGILITTCTLVSFFHGSNDGQKGMNLIMLVLIGTVPTAYALNRSLPPYEIAQFRTIAEAAAQVVDHNASGDVASGHPGSSVSAPGSSVSAYVSSHHVDASTYPSLAGLMRDIAGEFGQYRGMGNVPPDRVGQLRNDLYLASEATRNFERDEENNLSEKDLASLTAYRSWIDGATKFIPHWVKIAVSISLGLGTMIGWKRIVVTVGERIGRTRLSYAQGASAEITAAATIGVADGLGLLVSTTHVLSSGVAGSMVATGSGVHWPIVRNIALAWVFTLPAVMTLSGVLYFGFSRFF
jgi:PiT family inorganic phosphate transporter